MARTAENALAISSALSARERLLIRPARGLTGAEAQPAALLDAVRGLQQTGIASALIGGLAVGIRTGVPLQVAFDAELDRMIERAEPSPKRTRAGNEPGGGPFACCIHPC